MLSDLQDLVTALVRDGSSAITTDDRDAALDAALARYSADRPRTVLAALSGGGPGRLDLPDDWEPDVSRIASIEAPAGLIPPAFLASNLWAVHQTADGPALYLFASLAAGTDILLGYTVSHVVTAETDTVPARDREAVCCWAAALLLDQLASLTAGQGSPTIVTDQRDWETRSREYAARAKSLRSRYQDLLGVEDRRAAPAGVVVSHPDRDTRGQPRLQRRIFL